MAAADAEMKDQREAGRDEVKKLPAEQPPDVLGAAEDEDVIF